MRVTVGVLGAGSLVGQGIVKALRMSTLQVRLVALDFFPHAVGLYWADAAHLLPDVLARGVSETEYISRLIEILKRERVEVLLVGLDFEVPRLARCRDIIERESGSKVVVSSPEVAEIGDDKWATYEFLTQMGFPCPRTLIDLTRIDAFMAQVGLPLIVKPRRGATSRGVSLVRDLSELPHALKAAGRDPIVQESVGKAGSEYTCGAVVFDGECVGVIVIRRDLRDGNTFRAFLQPHPELEALVREAALALKPYGPVNFQLRVGQDGPAIFEINARFSGTTVIRALAGFNEVEAVIRWTVWGERVPLAQKKVGVVLRYWEEMFLSWQEYQRMEEMVVQ